MLPDSSKVALPEHGHVHLKHTEFEELELNLGPQHPSTHGVLRIVLTLDGETIIKAVPHVGYLHRGIEELGERRDYRQYLPYMDRLDYLSGISNELGLCLAVEQLAGIEVPRRAQYLRALVAEINRLASHLIFLATFGNDLAAVTVFLYGFRDREQFIDLLDTLSGDRLMYHYLRYGGVAADVPPGFDRPVHAACDYMEEKISDYDNLLTNNRIFTGRTVGVGALDPGLALDLGVSGPNLRASGVYYDVRKAHPYSAYQEFDFQVPLGKKGDCFDRYAVRLAEVKQSLRIVRQAIDGLPEGDFCAKVKRVLKPPAGETYAHVEGPRGDVGFYLVSDGSDKAYRVKLRGPSFVHVMALCHLLVGWKVADAIAIIGSIDVVLGEVDR